MPRWPAPAGLLSLPALAGLLGLSPLAGTAHAATADRVAAVVDDEVIALSEVYELGGSYVGQRCAGIEASATCVTDAELEVLDALIRRALVRRELVRLGLDVTGQEIDRAIDGMVQQYGMPDRDTLRKEFEAQGVPWETYREQVTEQLREMKFTDNVIRPRISVTDNEVRDLYQRTARDYATPSLAEIEAFGLTVAADADEPTRTAVLDEARLAVDELNAGKREWLATVKELDQVGYAARDGKMGTFRKGELAGPLDSLVFSAKPGQVVGPVDAGTQVVVIRVVSIQSTGVVPFDQVEARLREQVYQTKIEDAVEQWYQQTRREAAVRVLLGAQG